MLKVEQLQVAVGSRILLHDFNAHWSRGSLVCVLGANGVGKTSLLNHLVGLSPRSLGKVTLDDCDILHFSTQERVKRIASIAQHDSADLEITVFDRIAHGLSCRRETTSLSRTEETILVHQVAKALDISELLERPLYTLSGGQRKKVHIARCLVDDRADIFVLDEPDASLDAAAREQVLGLLKCITSADKLVIASLHHRDLAHKYAHIVIEFGQTELTNRIIAV